MCVCFFVLCVCILSVISHIMLSERVICISKELNNKKIVTNLSLTICISKRWIKPQYTKRMLLKETEGPNFGSFQQFCSYFAHPNLLNLQL